MDLIELIVIALYLLIIAVFNFFVLLATKNAWKEVIRDLHKWIEHGVAEDFVFSGIKLCFFVILLTSIGWACLG